ncbi:MAG: tRNA pseudouridine(55) synthase TruB [Christensenellales bacterium]
MNGFLNVLKPPGMTSSNVVSDLRHLLGEKKVGHTGTLDPFAAGVLPVCIGKATKLSDVVMAGSKSYLAELCLGMESDTQDACGSIVEVSKKDDATAEEFRRAASCFIGQIVQKTPMYSAVKIKGKKLYQYAHEGAHVEQPERTVEIHEIRLLQKTGKGKFLFDVDCSKGTYIRTLCSDMGRKMGSCAYMSFLLRLSSGGMRIEDAMTVEEIRTRHAEGELEPIPMDTPLTSFQAFHVSKEWYPVIKNGGSLPADISLCGTFRLYCGEEFVALADIDNGRIKMKSLLI